MSLTHTAATSNSSSNAISHHGAASATSVPIHATNVAHLRGNLLTLNKLRLLVGDNLDTYADMDKVTFDFEASRVRFYWLLLNCDNFDYNTTILDITLYPVTDSA
jgi:hypothetical protein